MIWILTVLLTFASLLYAKDDLTGVPMDDNGFRYIDTHRAYDKITLDGQLNEQDWQVINFQSSFIVRIFLVILFFIYIFYCGLNKDERRKIHLNSILSVKSG